MSVLYICQQSKCKNNIQLWHTWRLAIWKVPFSIRLIRPSFTRILWPSFSHWILGIGFPMMWQCSCAVEPGAYVWFDGPCRMMGGTRSEGAEGDLKDEWQKLQASPFQVIQGQLISKPSGSIIWYPLLTATSDCSLVVQLTSWHLAR